MTTRKTPPTQPVAASIELLELFSEHAETLRFPDVSQSTLQARMSALDEAALEVSTLQASLDAARDALAATRTDLGEHVKRAHAYASLYAESDPAMAQRLAEIPLIAPRRTSRKKAPKRTTGATPIEAMVAAAPVTEPNPDNAVMVAE